MEPVIMILLAVILVGIFAIIVTASGSRKTYTSNSNAGRDSFVDNDNNNSFMLANTILETDLVSSESDDQSGSEGSDNSVGNDSSGGADNGFDSGSVDSGYDYGSSDSGSSSVD